MELFVEISSFGCSINIVAFRKIFRGDTLNKSWEQWYWCDWNCTTVRRSLKYEFNPLENIIQTGQSFHMRHVLPLISTWHTWVSLLRVKWHHQRTLLAWPRKQLMDRQNFSYLSAFSIIHYIRMFHSLTGSSCKRQKWESYKQIISESLTVRLKQFNVRLQHDRIRYNSVSWVIRPPDKPQVTGHSEPVTHFPGSN